MSEWHKFFKNGAVLMRSPEEMRALGREIGKILMPGEVLGLSLIHISEPTRP